MGDKAKTWSGLFSFTPNPLTKTQPQSLTLTAREAGQCSFPVCPGLQTVLMNIWSSCVSDDDMFSVHDVSIILLLLLFENPEQIIHNPKSFKIVKRS